MKVVRPTYDASQDAALWSQVVEFLQAEEATNTLLLASLWENRQFRPEAQTFIALDDVGAVQGMASQEGTFLMLLSAGMSDEAADAILMGLVERELDVPGVMGPTATVERFAHLWERLTGGSLKPGMAQRILQTSSVIPPNGIEGSPRHFAEDDRDLLREWFTWFALDAEGARLEQAQRAADAMLNRLLEHGSGMFWLDGAGEPVSLACYKGRTPDGLRIGPVFTPKKHRRHGYGAAVTAAITRHALDQNVKFACLYTNAGNPTANHVYESIGYRFVADSMQYRFIWSTHDDAYDD